MQSSNNLYRNILILQSTTKSVKIKWYNTRSIKIYSNKISNTKFYLDSRCSMLIISISSDYLTGHVDFCYNTRISIFLFEEIVVNRKSLIQYIILLFLMICLLALFMNIFCISYKTYSHKNRINFKKFTKMKTIWTSTGLLLIWFLTNID